MSWMKELCDTYDNNHNMIANDSVVNPLCPVSFMQANIHIEITLDDKANFVNARELNKEEGKTFIPVVEESAGRASGIAPHPLSDNLTYIAGDYCNYISDAKNQKTSEARNKAYLSKLNEWCVSDNCPAQVKTIRLYLQKKTITENLISCGILKTDDKGMLPKGKYDKNMVRFIVLGYGKVSETWKNKDIISAYQKYYAGYLDYNQDKSICFISGDLQPIAENHPKGVLAASYGAKLVSANDMTDFTFRGRFANPGEAYSVSYEASQKAHLALKWLADMQGYTIGTGNSKRTYVCWNPEGKSLPMKDILGFTTDDENVPKTMPEYKRKIRDAINGYKVDFRENDQIIIMSLEAATTGRMSITYYNELQASDFFERIQKWYDNCNWEYTTFDKEKRPRLEIKTPTLRDIIRYAFGTEQGDMIKVSDKILIMQYQRLFHCVLDAQPIPRDFVQSVTVKASQPEGYSYGNHERVLSTACALISNEHSQDKGGNNKMKLDKSNNDRSYLFGRLLAVYEKIERNTFGKEEKREPNAIRMQSAYVQHPMYVRKILENAIIPYMSHLGPGSRTFFKDIIEEITLLFKDDDINNMNKSLDDTYLLGYYLQRAELKDKGSSIKEASKITE